MASDLGDPDPSQPDEREPARREARSSVIQDLASDVKIMIRSVDGLRTEVEELAEKNNSRWFTGKLIAAVLAIVTAMNVYGVLAINHLQDDLRQEVEDRSSANCQAIEVSRDALSGLVEALRSQTQQPLPEVEDPELAEILELGRERNRRFFDRMDTVIEQIQCNPS